MKILLIYPPVTIYGSGKVGACIPLGLTYLAAYLEKFGYEVSILDALATGINKIVKKGKSSRIGLSDKDIEKKIREYNPDIVGISIMFTAFEEDAFRVAQIVKKVRKNIVTVAGGAHVSIFPDKVVENPFIDIAVKGEGEITLLELVKAVEGNKELSGVKGIAYKWNKKVKMTGTRELIADLDSLPMPALTKLDLALYKDNDNRFSMRHPVFPIVTSRGCPNHCVYCSIHALWEHRWRGRSAKNVVDEIEHLVSDFGAREICLQDDSASVDKKRFREICLEIIKRKIDVRWTTPNGIAHWTLDEELLVLMKKSGCYRVTFGIESGNPEMRRWVGKPFSLDQARKLTQFANRLGMWTVATNIIGFPYETEEQIEDTINFSILSDVDVALFFRLGPRPGTPVFDIFKKEGWLPKNKKLLFSEEVACETKYIKGGRLFEIQSRAYQNFFKKRLISFINPLRILRKIRNMEDLIYVLRLSGAGLGLIKSVAFAGKGVTSKSYRV